MSAKHTTSRVYKATLTIVLASFMAACGVIAPKIEDVNLPDASYFEREYAASAANMALQSKARYFAWIEQFYQGSMLQPEGWLGLVQRCVASVPPEQQAQIEATANAVGRRIAAEWAKDNSLRNISTRHLSVWALALREAIDRGGLMTLFEQVSDDVDGLINGQLSSSAINSERYYEPEYNEFF